ncbi:MAG: biotin/lipoyl-binding protein [Chthoniobacterales bacterium]|nr:biotin/lipoyl-binding protein [Chthoniobacterales bacterium]
MFKNITIAGAIIGIAAMFLLVARLKKPDPVGAPLVVPASAPYETAIGARGIVESLGENVRISTLVNGVVEEVWVKVGDHVKKGAPLFRVDSRAARAAVVSREAEIPVLTARLEEAEANLAEKKDLLDRVNKLGSKNVASQEEVRRASFQHRAGEALLARAAAELQQGKALLAESQTDLDRTLVIAPRDGEILQVNIRAGEYAAAAIVEAILLGDTSILQLRADVDEDSAWRVRPGAPAVAYIKGTRDLPIPLTFVRVEPYILPKKSLTGESTERVDTRVLQIIYTFALPKTPVYVGQQMDVFIDGAAGAPAPGS